MNNILFWLQITVSVLLIVLIAVQQRGSGLGSAFGGGGQVYSTRRGIQKKIYIATIVIAAVFLVLGVANLVIA